MTYKSIINLNELVNRAAVLLPQISDAEFSRKVSPEKWSKKEILGHLIDSATNNHHRFIRAQYEANPAISYDQNEWNKFNFYQEIESAQVIHFWIVYNKQLLEIIQRIPEENLTKHVKVGESLVTLEFIIIDYVRHLEHHLKQIIKLEP